MNKPHLLIFGPQADALRAIDINHYTISHAENYPHALAIIKHITPNLALLDIDPSATEGMDICTALSQRLKRHICPIIILLEHYDEAFIMHAFDMGIADCMIKPLHGPLLKQRISHITRSHKIEQELRLLLAVVENTNEAVLVTDAHAKILKVNSGFTRITGYSSKEVIGKNPKILRSGRHDVNLLSATLGFIKNHRTVGR